MTSMSEAMSIVRQAENRMVGGYNSLAGVTPALVELHCQAWSFAGSTDAEAAEHGRAIRQHEQAIRESLMEISKRFRAIESATRAALQVVEESEAKRKAARSRLSI